VQQRLLAHEMAISVRGASGLIQAGYTKGTNHSIGVVICHPHPNHQGTMFNKVITTATKAAIENQLNTLRFNYRGVGASEGVYGDVVGETHDAVAAGQWLLNERPCQHLWLVGFSFGAAIAYHAQSQLPTCGVILICPSVEKMAFKSIPSAPLHVIQAEEDELVSTKAVSSWCEQQPEVDYHILRGASHFFHGKLPELKDMLMKIIGNSLEKPLDISRPHRK
tara:strand:- start:3351 stop:4016 length:666 start_codon:yes stop_codon:yes gene_type:complete